MPNNQNVAAQAVRTTHIILACDESGAKGYADRDETTPGETGVFAGLLVAADHLQTVAPDFDAVARKYASNEGKLHITDLPPDSQQALREEMYALIRKHKIPCFYEAIHVAGFHEAHKRQKTLISQAYTARQSAVKMGSPRTVVASMHTALFQGLYGKIIAFCLEREKLRLHIEVRTDRVDSLLVKNFEETAKCLLDFGAKLKRVTGFDPSQNKVVQGSIEIGPVPADAQIPVVVEHLELKVVDDRDGLVVAADVLANSLDYLFRTRSPQEHYRALNEPEAFKNHPLRDCLDSFQRWDGYNFTDSFYAHPLNPA